MKLKQIWIWAIMCAATLMGGCTTPNEEEGLNDGYGYVQFKLYKKASYVAPEQSTKATNDPLEWLAEAYKVEVLLSYGDNEISQTLTIDAPEGDAAEWGTRSSKLKLLVGDYKLLKFSLYNAEDKVIYTDFIPEGEGNFTVVGGGLVVHDITVNVQGRGKVKFNLAKDMEGFATTRAGVEREYTFDEISQVSLVFKRAGHIEPTTIDKLPCKFDVHYDTSDEIEDGYKTSSIECDSLIWMETGVYELVSYQTYASDGVLLENNTSPKKQSFEIQDNKTTEATIKVTLYEADEYIQDYYALKEIWESLDGENWYYIGEEFSKGCNWDFNKDVDLWGNQPGVKLHANGRVAYIDVSNFGFRGEMLSPAIGRLTELVELYLGTHNDTNFTYDPTLDKTKSLSDRSRNRMQYHSEWLRSIHTPIQMSEPCARALAENNISIAATSLYKTMSESEIIDPKSGIQRNIHLMDSSHGTLCNGLKRLPEEIGNLKKLEYLYIANSEIEELPDSIEELESLTDFELYNCPKMVKFPMAVTRMPSLVSVNIANNAQWSAEEIYKGLDGLATGPSKEKLQILYCRQNSLAELPASFRNMKKLGLLDLAFNKIEKLHPLGKEVAFVQLYLDNNRIAEFPTDEEGYFCGYDDVENFSANYNRLTKVPNIFNAKSAFTMASVSFAGNQIDGFEGEENGTYKGINVETFTLSQNKFKAYPKALAETNSMVNYIILRANEISEIEKGVFTYENSVNLTSLDLSYNKITKLPWDMHSANLPYLYGVDVSFNSFSEFPYEPLDSAGLTVLAVRSQRDSNGARCLKEWPTGIGSHRGLRGLYLGSNDLRVIEDSISTLIYYLDISDNPNIVFDAADICYAWSVGAYILVYDRTQNILNCNAMLE